MDLLYLQELHMSGILQFLTLFDESLPAPSTMDIVMWVTIILIASNLIFIVLFSLFKIDVNTSLDDERQKEYTEWKQKKINPFMLAISELTNSVIFSPLSEELVFRFLLMKVICIEKLQLDVLTANVIQSVLFGSLHLTNNLYSTQTSRYTTLQTISAMISGFVSGWVYQKSNSILPALFAHMINNFMASGQEVFEYWKQQ